MIVFTFYSSFVNIPFIISCIIFVVWGIIASESNNILKGVVYGASLRDKSTSWSLRTWLV